MASAMDTTTTMEVTMSVEKGGGQEGGAAGKEYKLEIVWVNILKFVVIHTMAIVGLFYLPKASIATLVFAYITLFISGMGVTAGAHRYWTHRSYKARLPFQIFLMLANCMATENSIYVWSRDHRVHHKFSETDADPHNAKRGFFFAHMGWLMCRKHPDVISKGSKIDMSDLASDPVVMFQHNHYLPLTFLANIFIPTVIPALFWGESMMTAYFIGALRYIIVLHTTWLVNSAAHMWGDKPYDVGINPSENVLVSFLAAGEGFHNYHHTFPHDYSTSEWRYSLNLTTFFIDCMASIGQVYDRRSMSKELVESRIQRTGPGSSGVVKKKEM